MEIFKIAIKDLLKVALQAEEIETTDKMISDSIEIPPDPTLGDISSNLPFKLSKKLQKSPRDIATILTDRIEPSEDDLLDRVEVAGAGYINFYLDPVTMVQRVVSRVLQQQENYGSANLGKGRKLVVEHTATNPTKPLHIGHLRNAVLGDTIARIQEKCGWKVEIQNYIDDMGQQMAILVWAFLEGLQKNVTVRSDEAFDVFLGRVYCEGAEALDNEAVQDAVAETLRLMKSDREMFLLSRGLAENCVIWNLRTVWRIGVAYDLLFWESDVALSGIWDETFEMLKANSNFELEGEGENKGCFVARLGRLEEFKGEKSPDKILVRSNGIPTYVAHDIALQMWKFGLVSANLRFRYQFIQETLGLRRELWSTTHLLGDSKEEFGGASSVCNVIGVEQNYLQRIVKLTFRLMGDDEHYQNSYHLSYKHVRLPGERFSGRECNWYEERAWADAVIDDAVEMAIETAREKRPELSPKDWRIIGESIGIGAVRYWLLKFSTETEITFVKEDATSLEGDTAPFLVYSLIRCRGIQRKAQESGINGQKPIFKGISSAPELALARTLAAYPEKVREASKSMKPSVLTAYAFELASLFNKFYEKCPVLSASSPELVLARLYIVKATTQVLENILTLLGIPVPLEM
ncbi:MAG: arginine--tRNA ligase [Candidatus Heimdallarchaeota archaeon]